MTVLINPRISDQVKQEIKCIIPSLKKRFPGHIWFMTSGTHKIKWVGLSKDAIRCSAEAVNKHLQVTHKDVWLRAIPDFHVGGYGIQMRAELGSNKIIDFWNENREKWGVDSFYQTILESFATLTSLVPTQIYDIVAKHLKSPPSLRAVLVGGGALSKRLYDQARALGWPVLTTYGMTECASQIATQDLSDYKPHFKLLNHIQIKTDTENRVWIKSPSLLTTYAIHVKGEITFVDPKQGDWFLSDDFGNMIGEHLILKGRSSDFIKIGGETVSLVKLEELLAEKSEDAPIVLVAISDERLGKVIHAVVEKEFEGKACDIIEEFNQHVMPYENIRKLHVINQLPRTSLGKVRKAILQNLFDQG